MMAMVLKLHNLYRLNNGEYVVAIEDRGTYMCLCKLGEVPGYHHNYDGTHVDHDKPDMDVSEFRVVTMIEMSENGTIGHEVEFK